MQIKTTRPVGHCTARLREALAIEEEEALRFKVRIRREVKDEKRKVGKRWTTPARFDVPAPHRPSRPVSPQGKVSFHFAFETVSKGSGGKSVLSGGSRSILLSTSALWDYDSYISREDAVLAVSAATFEQYVGRSPIDDTPSGVTAAILSNISDDLIERQNFWRAVHRCERTAGVDRLAFSPGALSRASWLKLAACEDIPMTVRSLASQFGKRGSVTAAKSRNKIFADMERSEGRAIIEIAKRELGEAFTGNAIKVSKARAGRTQYRLTGEFPIHVDAAGRLRILTRFCKELQRLGVMYTAAIHEPDGHNDERNHHFHIALYDRPCAKVPGSDLWDFEYREKVQGQSNRYRFPLRQPKIAEFSRDSARGEFRDHWSAMIYSLRTRFADLCNDELERVGCSRLFDPRTFSKMGIARTPTKPLGPKAAPLEAAGIPTPGGIANAEIIWSAELERVRDDADEKRRARVHNLNRIREAIRAAEEKGLHELASTFERHAGAFRAGMEILDLHERDLEEYRVTLDMAWSRAEKCRKTCERIVASLERRRGSKADKRDENLIRIRANEAQSFDDRILQIDIDNSSFLDPIIERVRAARVELATTFDDFERTRVELDAQAARPKTICLDIAGPLTTVEEPELDPLKEMFDQLFDELLNERTVQSPERADGIFTVPGVPRRTLKVLTKDRYHNMVQSRLAGIAKLQERRVRQALELRSEYGQDGLLARCESDHLARRAIRHLEVYETHPLIRAATLNDDCKMPTPATQAPIIAQSEADTPKPQECPSSQADPEDLQTPQPMPAGRSWVIPDSSDSRKKGIEAYATFIRTGEKVEIGIVDGRPEPNQASLADWGMSATAWADEPTIRQAVQDRYEADNERILRKRQRVRAVLADSQSSNTRIDRDRLANSLVRKGGRYEDALVSYENEGSWPREIAHRHDARSARVVPAPDEGMSQEAHAAPVRLPDDQPIEVPNVDTGTEPDDSDIPLAILHYHRSVRGKGALRDRSWFLLRKHSIRRSSMVCFSRIAENVGMPELLGLADLSPIGSSALNSLGIALQILSPKPARKASYSQEKAN